MKRSLFIFSSIILAASLLGSAAVIRQRSVQTFGTVSGLPDPSLAPRPQPLAVNVALEHYPQLDPVLDSLTAFHWLRQTFPWDEIEPTRGEYNWKIWDEIVTRTVSRQKEIIAVLEFSPAWARDGDSDRSGPPVSPDDFATFAGLFAQRYADSINVYQIWDEPNLTSGWGDHEPSAAAYAALLQKAYTAIHAADPTATILTAALAPTTETGPKNISDLIYLQQLYDLGASHSFDAAAGKPYGFHTSPDDRLADPAILNFSRFTLLRQVMEKNGDGAKLLWGGDFGWNTRASPWGQVTPEQQTNYTLTAYQRALDEWPWAGPLALDSYQPALPPDDPHWGFALADPSGQLTDLGKALNAHYADFADAVPGNYAAQSPAAHYVGAWKFSDLGADIPEDFSGARIEITFRGTDLALKVRRGDYRGYLYVEIDGQPANLLPRDTRGAYLVLTSPDLTPQVNTIPVASTLTPDQPHHALIQPERGWDQWAFAGFSVGHHFPDNGYSLILGVLAAIILLSGAGMWHFGRGLDWGGLGTKTRATWNWLGDTGQLLLTALVGGLLYLSTSLTFGNELIAFSRRFGDTLPILVTALTAGLFYFSPSFLVAIASLIILFILFYLRLDLALAFTALFIPLYLQPRLLWQHGLALVEITLFFALASWVLNKVQSLKSKVQSPKSEVQSPKSKVQSPKSEVQSPKSGVRSQESGAGNQQPPSASNQSALHFPPSTLHFPPSTFHFPPSSFILHPSFAVLLFLAVSTISLFTAEIKNVAIHEYRLVVLDPIIFYFLLRWTPLDRKALWRIVDFFLLGALIISAIGLYQYFTHTDLITAEGGLARIRSVYGSPNNLALYLGRALPIAVAVALLGKNNPRRIIYALAALVIAWAIYLTYSKGALFLGVPAALAVILICWLGRRGLILIGAGATASLAALPILKRIPRFADLLNPLSGTSFFRIKVWVSAFRMFLDHPLLGVGLDNFLYQYRSKYILPEAWEEQNLSHPHNIALDYLSRLGLLGFAGGVWLQIAFWRVAVDAYRRLRASTERDLWALSIGLMASMADMLVHGIVDNSYFLLDLAFAFFLTLALIQRIRDA
jgi:O-antigen ligase